MLEIIRNKRGNISAVCEWLPYNRDGKIDPKGDLILIAELEINKSARRNGMIKKIFKEIHKKVPYAESAFWWRKRKYPDREHKFYSTDKLIKRLGG